MEYITTKEASAKWGISTIRITVLANEGRIPGAQHLGKSWLIPANATKPEKRKANHSGFVKKETEKTDNFSFPLYHFRPDWSYIKDEQLTAQQKNLLLAETALLECRFKDAFSVLEIILQSPEDTVTEIGALWSAGICCIGLNKPEHFSKIYLRLQLLLSEEFSHRDDLLIVLELLKTYIETIGSTAQNNKYNTDIHAQCLPLMCMQNSYSLLVKEVMNVSTVDTNSLEINLRFVESTGAIIVMEMMHIYLLGIYYLRQDMELAQKHAKAAVQIAYENKFYFPLVTYYRYFTPILSSTLEQYPVEFQHQCKKLISQFQENYTAFFSSISEYILIAKLPAADFQYIYAVLMDLSNSDIAKRLGVSPRTVKRRLGIISEELGVHNKKELKDYLYKYM